MDTRSDQLGVRDYEKQAAARAAAQLVQSGTVVGLGSGSTATYAIRCIAERVRAGLSIVAIPTSEKSRQLADELGIPLTTLDEHPEIDIALDGADEIDRDLNLIKGGGGALLREKIIASASRRFIVIADSAKQVLRLGKFPLPVEVIPFAQTLIAMRIAVLGAQVTLRRATDGDPYVTDEGHQILDCTFGEIADAGALARKLEAMAGVVEHGLFIGMTEMALVGTDGEVLEIHPRDQP
ncbi:MAG: ribose-5-phosphate isomerase RpiA [Acidobacteria bacterium]|nr:ribose-5-phosphate isomerase RpiA [Acidobacteriota bacterium]MBV9625570.1 ribose-5-phosphate isomerase RpiA [Acidobacteriota bacterium]